MATVPALQAQANKPGPQDFGKNFEKLAELRPELASELRRLVDAYREEGAAARRNEIFRIKKARMFWQGWHYGWRDGDRWVVPYVNANLTREDAEKMPKHMWVTNFYLARGRTFISVMSGDVPNARFAPGDASKVEDLTAAKAAQETAELVEFNNKPKNLMRQIAFYLWTDGKIGGYVRYVADGQRFGTRDEPDFGQGYSPMGEDTYTCPACGKQYPEEQVAASGMLSCPDCGATLGPENMQQAERVAIPQITQTKKVPNGQEVVSIVGGLELNTPIWANEQHEFPYLQWQNEVHRAKLKASYPHIKDKIQEGSGDSGGDDTQARTSRLGVAQGLPDTPGDTLGALVTFSRTWIRPWAFYDCKDELRDELLQLFPDGCYVAFAGSTYCEARNESMDRKWRVMHALPGDGQNRPSVGDPMININEKFNTLDNIGMETFERGIGTTYADPEVLSFDALADQTAEPGAIYPARPRAGQSLGNSFHDTQSQQVPASMQVYADNMAGPVTDALTGLFPAIFGGEMQGAGGETAQGYAQAREQAMGLIGEIWGQVKDFYPELLKLGVECFRENRPDDVQMTVEGESGDWKSKTIRVSELQGNIHVRAEGDEQFPRTQAQKRGTLLTMYDAFGEDPVFQETAHLPANQEFTKNALGLEEWELPAEQARHKQMREIDAMLEAAPIPQVTPNAMGLPELAMQSSIPIDELLDDHAAEFQVIKTWATSEEGQRIKRENPAGFANVRAHAEAHAKEMAAMAMAMMPPPTDQPAGKGDDKGAPAPPAMDAGMSAAG